MKTRLLAFSSSREGNSSYLQTAAPVINKFLEYESLAIAFIPFASVDPDYEAYTNKVRVGLSAFKYKIKTVTAGNDHSAIENADAIMVGGGNTFKLLHDLYSGNLLELIRTKVKSGIPYIGWSAGSNIAGATICTSNDMPIINPGSFNALNFLPFQINPHYYNQPLEGFNDETRDQRLAEFLQMNPSVPIVALPEGTALLKENGSLKLVGDKSAILFKWENNEATKQELASDSDLSFLLL